MLKNFGLPLATSFMVTLSYAKDFGVQGTTFEIREPSLLELIYTRLRGLQSTNKLVDHQKEIQEKVRRSIESPLPIDGIGSAVSYQQWTYDPSIIIDEDIKDHEGNIIVRKGAHVNPLDHHSFGKPLLFIKGEDEAHVDWALKQEGKVVLVSGRPLHLIRTHNKLFYYDQGAVLSKKFGIIAVPARVSQKGKMLLIEQFDLQGEKRS